MIIPDFAYIKIDNNQIKYFRPFLIERVEIASLCEINYHYHAAVGFIAVWEFIVKNGNSMVVYAETIGLKKVLKFLESSLPGFSLNISKQMFDNGDVEDSLNIWNIE